MRPDKEKRAGEGGFRGASCLLVLPFERGGPVPQFIPVGLGG